MYKVILVDDDYPVLETLSEAVDWKAAGFELNGLYENGAAAMQGAAGDPPDVVITDIGMPKMNGIELVRELKAVKPELKAIIVTCHDEFEYAKLALQLNVHEYLLKETLEPEQLHTLLLSVKQQLDMERQESEQVERLQRLAQRSSMLLKQQFIRQFLQHPLVYPELWLAEAKEYGVEIGNGMSCLPIIAHIDRYQAAKQRFMLEDTLMFAVSNVNDEVLRDSPHRPSPDDRRIRDGFRAVHFVYDARRSFILIFFRPSLKVNIYTEAENMLRQVQGVLKQTLKLTMTFIKGRVSSEARSLQTHMLELRDAERQRFYMDAGIMGAVISQSVMGSAAAVQAQPGSREDLFEYYDRAMSEFRDMLSDTDAVMQDRESSVAQTVRRWMAFIHNGRYEPEVVKDWVLKLLLDMKLKFHSMIFFRTDYSAEILHKEAAELAAMHEVEAWLLRHIRTLIARMNDMPAQSQRSEIQQACQYVERHLDKRITLDEVASQLHLNASYFSRLFRKEKGVTFIEYVTRVKMNRAKELLDQTSYPVSKICEMLGYDNQSYFIKTFKSAVGLTPSEYRGHHA